jgi:predicted nucleic acid-binding protein
VIAVDTSSLVAYLRGDEGRDVEAIEQAFQLKQAVLPPVVLTEILSFAKLQRRVASLIRELPMLETRPGFWERAAMTRAKIISKRLRARLADTLICQSCLDHRILLITRDSDFRHFAKHAGLELA